MLQDIWAIIEALLGLKTSQLQSGQIILRALIVYVQIFKNGENQSQNLHSGVIGPIDLTSELRQERKVTDPAQVEADFLEPNGNISVIQRKRKLTVLDIRVENGVQMVRV